MCVIFQYLDALHILFVLTYIFHLFNHKQLNGISQGVCFVKLPVHGQVALLRDKRVCYNMFRNSSACHCTFCVPLFQICGYYYLVQTITLLNETDLCVSSFNNWTLSKFCLCSRIYFIFLSISSLL